MSWVITAAPMFMNELTVLMIAAATPEKTRPAREDGGGEAQEEGWRRPVRVVAGGPPSPPEATRAFTATPTPK